MGRRAVNLMVFLLSTGTLAGLVAGGDLDTFPEPPPHGANSDIAVGTTDGRHIYLDFTDAHGPAPPASNFQISINGAPRGPPTLVTGDGTLQLSWPAGFGSADTIRLEFDGSPEYPAFAGRIENQAPNFVLPTPRTHATAATLNGQVYIFGGMGFATEQAGEPILSIQSFDPETGMIRTVAETLASPLMNAIAVADPRKHAACPEGCIYLVGGKETPDAELHQPIIQRFNAATHQITQWIEGLLPSASYQAVLGDDALYIHSDETQPSEADVRRGSIIIADTRTGTHSTAIAYTPQSAGGVAMAWTAQRCSEGCAYLFSTWSPTNSGVEDGVATAGYNSYPYVFDPVLQFAAQPTPGAFTNGYVWPPYAPVIDGKVWLLQVSDCNVDCNEPARTGVFDPATNVLDWRPLLVEARPDAAWATGPETYALGGIVDGAPSDSIEVLILG